MDKLKILALRLKELRDSLGLNQSEFSESIQLKQQTYSLYERGSNKPPIDLLIKIAEKYSVSLDWLCGFSNSKQEKINLDTFSDVLCLIFKLSFLDGIEVDTNFCKVKEEIYQNYPNIDSSYENFMMIYFNDTRINNILRDWKKMLDHLKENLIDEEIFDLWIEKTLKKCNSFYSADHNVRTKNEPINIPDDIPDESPFS